MNKDKENFIGKYGFKNNAPAYSNNNWGRVQLFLDTWGFLPNDNSILNKLSKDQLIKLCIFCLETSCIIDLEGNGVKAIQEIMNSFSISPDKLNNPYE